MKKVFRLQMALSLLMLLACMTSCAQFFSSAGGFRSSVVKKDKKTDEAEVKKDKKTDEAEKKNYWLKDSVLYSEVAQMRVNYGTKLLPSLSGASAMHAFVHVGEYLGTPDSLKIIYENGAEILYFLFDERKYEERYRFNPQKGRDEFIKPQLKDMTIFDLKRVTLPNGDFYTEDKDETEIKAKISYIDGKITANGQPFGFIYNDKGVQGWKQGVADTDHFLIEYKDGTKYEGSFIGADLNFQYEDTRGIAQLLSSNSIAEMKLRYNDGVLTYPDGTVEYYLGGQSRTERDGEYDERVNARKAREKADKEKYDRLCAQYGKKYADAAWKGQVIVGMPEKLMLDYVGVTLWHDSGSIKWYEIRSEKWAHVVGEQDLDVWHISVEDGKVTRITHYDAWK
ncbi:MAG: hypothetical protein SPL50_05905 [Alloprevotella sp.]|nr:hypothetical protein [Alloprevotella sp.]